jgi:hypothetical protein
MTLAIARDSVTTAVAMVPTTIQEANTVGVGSTRKYSTGSSTEKPGRRSSVVGGRRPLELEDLVVGQVSRFGRDECSLGLGRSWRRCVLRRGKRVGETGQVDLIGVGVRVHAHKLVAEQVTVRIAP